MKLLDTSVAVDFLRDREPAVELVTELVSAGDAFASELVRFELLTGLRASEFEHLERFFSALSWVGVDETIARRAGELARRYRAAYSGIDAVDYLLAATALVLEAELVTTNVRHYPMLPNVAAPY